MTVLEVLTPTSVKKHIMCPFWLFFFPEGVYELKAVVHDFHRAEELGPYYVDISHGNVSVFMNSSSIHDSEALSFADSLPQQRGKTCAWKLNIQICAAHVARLLFSCPYFSHPIQYTAIAQFYLT